MTEHDDTARRAEATLTTTPPNLAAPDLIEEDADRPASRTLSGSGAAETDGMVASAMEAGADKLGQAVEGAQQAASQVAEGTQQVAGQVAERAQQAATSQATARKDQAVDTLGAVAEALRQVGRQLRDQDQGAIAGYGDQAAERVDRVAGYLRERDVRDIVGEVEGFARRQPALFLSGAFTLGLVAARFLKSSGQQAAAGGSGGSGQRSGQESPALPAASPTSSPPWTEMAQTPDTTDWTETAEMTETTETAEMTDGPTYRYEAALPAAPRDAAKERQPGPTT